jgi:hypothetical protein
LTRTYIRETAYNAAELDICAVLTVKLADDEPALTFTGAGAVATSQMAVLRHGSLYVAA